jgi:proteic killer suppression protein
LGVKYRLTLPKKSDVFEDVIRSFRVKTLRAFFEGGDRRRLSVPNAARIRRILLVLDAASEPQQANVPGYFSHALRGERRWSIRVSGNWRITFGWEAADAIDVDLENYH